MNEKSAQRLLKILSYSPITGVVKTQRGRPLIGDSDGLVIVYDSEARPKSKKYKLERIAYFLAFGSFPREDQRVLHKNLEPEDNRLTNLSLVSRSVYKQIKEASRNVSGGIRLVPHATDQFSYVLHWFENGAEKVRLVQDIVVARRYMVRLQLKYSKILTKFCVFDN